jgi:hypothetical protein
VHRNQAFELADELGVATGGEIQLDPPLQCSQAKLLEAPGLRLGELRASLLVQPPVHVAGVVDP